MHLNKKEEEPSQGLFVLLLGPSGAGKSTVIKELAKQLDITYITPVMDRSLRSGETEKVSVSPEEFTRREQSGEFIIVNHLYGFRYGTPKALIEQTLANRGIAILDFPLAKLNLLSDYRQRGVLLTFYILPPSNEELARRLAQDNRDLNGVRLTEGLREIKQLQDNGLIHPNIDFFITNHDPQNAAQQIKQLILSD